MNLKFLKRVAVCLVFVLTALLSSSCQKESDEFVNKKLDSILEGDLKAITEGLPDSSLLDKPYYKITICKSYEKGLYAKKAVAEFYFFKKLGVKIERKYRYSRSKRMWERYFNEYRYSPDSTSSAMVK
jgi:hypothetical protein